MIAENSIIELDVSIGEGTKVWYFVHIMQGARIGRNCNIGDYCFFGKKVIVGDGVKFGNNVNIYQGTIIKDRVFIGNNVSFTNVRKPRIGKIGKILDTIIEEGVSIGANSTIVGGIKIGKNATIADGSVVFFDVQENSFVAGNPAKVKSIKKEE